MNNSDEDYASVKGSNKISKTEKKLLKKTTENEEKFHYSFLYIKIVFFVLLIISSYYNRDTDFIKNNKSRFIIETLIYGIVATIPIIWMEIGRKSKDGNAMSILIWFVVMILFNVTFQLSGLYSILYPDQNLERDDENIVEGFDINYKKSKKLLGGLDKSFYTTTGLVVVAIVGYLMYLAFKIRNFNIKGYGADVASSFLIETIVFGLCNSVPMILIGYNRERNNPDYKFNKEIEKYLKETVLVFLKMCALHVVLQASSFYNHTFGWE